MLVNDFKQSLGISLTPFTHGSLETIANNKNIEKLAHQIFSFLNTEEHLICQKVHHQWKSFILTYSLRMQSSFSAAPSLIAIKPATKKNLFKTLPIPSDLFQKILFFMNISEFAKCQGVDKDWKNQADKSMNFSSFIFEKSERICRSISKNILRTPGFSAVQAFSAFNSRQQQQYINLFNKIIDEFEKRYPVTPIKIGDPIPDNNRPDIHCQETDDEEKYFTLIGMRNLLFYGPQFIDKMNCQNLRWQDAQAKKLFNLYLRGSSDFSETQSFAINHLLDMLKIAYLLSNLVLRVSIYKKELFDELFSLSCYSQSHSKREKLLNFYFQFNARLARVQTQEEVPCQNIGNHIFKKELPKAYTSRKLIRLILEDEEFCQLNADEPTLNFAEWIKNYGQKVREILQKKQLWKEVLCKSSKAKDYSLLDESTLDQFLKDLFDFFFVSLSPTTKLEGYV